MNCWVAPRPFERGGGGACGPCMKLGKEKIKSAQKAETQRNTSVGLVF